MCTCQILSGEHFSIILRRYKNGQKRARDNQKETPTPNTEVGKIKLTIRSESE